MKIPEGEPRGFSQKDRFCSALHAAWERKGMGMTVDDGHFLWKTVSNEGHLNLCLRLSAVLPTDLRFQ